MGIEVRLSVLSAQLSAKRLDAGGKKVTLEAVSDEAGVSYSSIQRLASGKSKRCDFATLGKLCKFFECEVGDLLVYSSADES